MAETGDDGIVQAEPVRQPRHDHEDGEGLLLGMGEYICWLGNIFMPSYIYIIYIRQPRHDREDGKGLLGMRVNVFVGKC